MALSISTPSHVIYLSNLRPGAAASSDIRSYGSFPTGMCVNSLGTDVGEGIGAGDAAGNGSGEHNGQ